jgi:CRISPR-associated protein Csb2
MLLIELGFPAGRYHATAWGRHVNEGVPEWPPSPYRLVRALFDAWKRKRPTWEQARVQLLLSALSSAAPSFHLPDVTASHTRSFLSKNEEDPQSKTLIFDAFVVLSPRATVLMGWPEATLDVAAVKDLDELLSLLNYLGRSESWISARLLSGVSAVKWNCFPEQVCLEPGELEIVPVAAPVPEGAYQPIRAGRGKGARTLDWMDALASGTDLMMKAGWNHPPAMHYVDYLRPAGCFEPGDAPLPTYRIASIRSVLYAFDSKVLPLVTDSLEVAQRARDALMSFQKDDVSPKFSGKDQDSKPLIGHQHAFFLPLDENRDGRIDHLLIHCRTDFNEGERRALDRLDHLYQRGGKPELRCIPVQWNPKRMPSKCFASSTPFVPVRHFKPKREEFDEWIHAEIARECVNHGLPLPLVVDGVRELIVSGSRPIRWFEFRRNRKNDPVRSGFGVRIEFDQEVDAPFALGYGCHFGLGQFASVKCS